MSERLLADETGERITAGDRCSSEMPPAGDVAVTMLSLQRTAGNAAVGGALARSAWPPPAPGGAAMRRTLQRCSAGGCTCGGACGGHRSDEEELSRGGLALRRAVAARRVLSRQHDEGGPYHPPEGTLMACSMADGCSSISTKINYLRHTIRRHQEWDQANPDPRWPGGRHAAEIADLQRALSNCIAIASTKCRGQPIYIPVPESQESREERAERVRRQLYEALPWAVAVLVVGLVVACVIAEPCGAAVLAAVAAIAGEEAVATVMAILVANGVLTAG